MNSRDMESIIRFAVREDAGRGDVTSNALFRRPLNVAAEIIAREECVVCGTSIAKKIFRYVDRRIKVKIIRRDGTKVQKNATIALVYGPVKGVLRAERTALNFLSRLSGIATLSYSYASRTVRMGAEIFDTRKTTPGLREVEKYAVRTGGAHNHRRGLYDGILIKDNHITAVAVAKGVDRLAAIRYAIEACRAKKHRNMAVEIEVGNLAEFKAALRGGPDIIMLDNMRPADARKARRLRDAFQERSGKKVLLEASGNIGLDNISAVARTGIDRISIGKLTHSAPAIDFSLEIRESKETKR